MTRGLGELLGAREPAFQLGLQQLERMSGGPSEDIRLDSEVRREAREALRDLGLDPDDTIGPELYNALQERFKNDNAAVCDLLGTSPRETNLMLRTRHFVDTLNIPKSTFALKPSIAKRLLKRFPPKKAMKRLGYRSVDSMLKHEPVPQLYAAAAIAESAQWHRSFLVQYRQLLPSDFEMRNIALFAPDAKRWHALSADYMHEFKHNIFAFKELGAVVLLPLAADAIDGAALATLLLTIDAINDIRSVSVFLKLHQVRPDFGMVLEHATCVEPYTQASLTGEGRLPWKLVQHYFAHTPGVYSTELFEPHVQPEDLKTTHPENVLAKLHVRFDFWKNKAHLGSLHDDGPVSFNLLDAALNFCNKRPYERRIVHYFRDRLRSELMRRYMHQENLEQAIHGRLSDELVDDKPLA